MAQDYLQLAYVTNDFDRAIAEVRRARRMGPFKEMRALRLPTGRKSIGVSHYALAFEGQTQLEIIEPLDGDVSLYRSLLPDEGFALRFHHLGHYFTSEAEFWAARRDMNRRWDIVLEAAVFDGFYCYADARADDGHYQEIFTFPGGRHLDGVPRY